MGAVHIFHFVATGHAQACALADALAPRGIVPNADKQETLVRFAGKGSQNSMRTVYTPSHPAFKHVRRHARYLGPHLSVNGSLAVECRRRLVAARQAYGALGAFWSSTNNNRWKGVVFNSMVVGSLVTGLCSFVITKQVGKALDTLAAQLARKVLLGSACDKTAAPHPVSKTNMEVFRLLRVHVPTVFLRVQRLRWLQKWVQRSAGNILPLAALFGYASWESPHLICRHGDPSGDSHAWWQHLCDDLVALAEVSAFDEVVRTTIQTPTLLLTEPWIRDVFLRCDPGVLLAKQRAVEVPPPGCSLAPTHAAEPERPFVCTIETEGVPCGARFETNRSLVHHTALSKKPGHGRRQLARILTVSNQCLLCGNLYASREYAATHMAKSFSRGFCPDTVGSCTVRDHLTVPPYTCQLCEIEFPNIQSAQMHLASHIPPDLDALL